MMDTKAGGQLSVSLCVSSVQYFSDRLLECDGGELQGFCLPVYIDSCLRSSHGVFTVPVRGNNNTQQLNAGRHVPLQLFSLCSVKKLQGKNTTHSTLNTQLLAKHLHLGGRRLATAEERVSARLSHRASCLAPPRLTQTATVKRT